MTLSFARTAIAHATLLILTSVHHWYAAIRFETPWRAHVVHLAMWAGVALGVLLGVGWHARGRAIGRWAVLAILGLSTIVAVVWLGLYEGGYNHLVKNAIFATGASDETFHRLFPPAIYEPPGDSLFELSGIAQLPLGLFAGWSALTLWRTAGMPAAA
jgi:hypothetical protein